MRRQGEVKGQVGNVELRRVKVWTKVNTAWFSPKEGSRFGLSILRAGEAAFHECVEASRASRVVRMC